MILRASVAVGCCCGYTRRWPSSSSRWGVVRASTGRERERGLISTAIVVADRKFSSSDDCTGLEAAAETETAETEMSPPDKAVAAELSPTPFVAPLGVASVAVAPVGAANSSSDSEKFAVARYLALLVCFMVCVGLSLDPGSL